MSIRSIVPTARSGSTGKVVSAREAVRLIRVGDTVAIGGFFAIGLAIEVIHELGAVFEATDEETLGFGKPTRALRRSRRSSSAVTSPGRAPSPDAIPLQA